MEQKTQTITILKTGEKIEAYKLQNGNWYDYKGMGEDQPATSSTGQKEFTKAEVKSN